MRAWRMPQYSGTAHSTPGTLRTRCTSMSRRPMVSLTCSTLASLTQMGTLMFCRVAVVSSMRPQKTEDCCVMSSEQKVRPQTSMAYFARSP